MFRFPIEEITLALGRAVSERSCSLETELAVVRPLGIILDILGANSETVKAAYIESLIIKKVYGLLGRCGFARFSEKSLPMIMDLVTITLTVVCGDKEKFSLRFRDKAHFDDFTRFIGFLAFDLNNMIVQFRAAHFFGLIHKLYLTFPMLLDNWFALVDSNYIEMEYQLLNVDYSLVGVSTIVGTGLDWKFCPLYTYFRAVISHHQNFTEEFFDLTAVAKQLADWVIATRDVLNVIICRYDTYKKMKNIFRSNQWNSFISNAVSRSAPSVQVKIWTEICQYLQDDCSTEYLFVMNILISLDKRVYELAIVKQSCLTWLEEIHPRTHFMLNLPHEKFVTEVCVHLGSGASDFFTKFEPRVPNFSQQMNAIAATVLRQPVIGELLDKINRIQVEEKMLILDIDKDYPRLLLARLAHFFFNDSGDNWAIGRAFLSIALCDSWSTFIIVGPLLNVLSYLGASHVIYRQTLEASQEDILVSPPPETISTYTNFQRESEAWVTSSHMKTNLEVFEYLFADFYTLHATTKLID